ncbi:hypothetical protein H9632_18650 [Solibacillus sp. Sa1YVA6]|uniref:Tox-SHH domain-containing protein n=1 Tax=Solibacillus merdavium TaxID=2762218 RepID=A0ABR8XT13_9BACL|nr:hypothetical protein [Solibacillus merdavium]
MESWERGVSVAAILGGPLVKGVKHSVKLGAKAVSGATSGSKATNKTVNLAKSPTPTNPTKQQPPSLAKKEASATTLPPVKSKEQTKGADKTRAEYLRDKYGKLSSEQIHANINDRAGASFLQRSTKSDLKKGGYGTNDIDAYKKMSPNKNRAPGSGTSKLDGLVQAHHAIQDEWAKLWAKRNGIKYSSSNAPSLLLKSISGESHAIISSLQRARRRAEGFNTSIVYEFNESYREMIKAGVDHKVAKKVTKEAYRFFDGLGGFK